MGWYFIQPMQGSSFYPYVLGDFVGAYQSPMTFHQAAPMVR